MTALTVVASAAVITPVGGIQYGDDFHVFYSGTEVVAPEGWTVRMQPPQRFQFSPSDSLTTAPAD